MHLAHRKIMYCLFSFSAGNNLVSILFKQWLDEISYVCCNSDFKIRGVTRFSIFDIDFLSVVGIMWCQM